MMMDLQHKVDGETKYLFEMPKIEQVTAQT